MKEFYTYESLMAFLKECNSVVFLHGYDYDNNNVRYNIVYYKGKFATNKGFNLCANFSMHKLTNTALKSIFKKCCSAYVTECDFSDKQKKEAYNYDNFIKSFKW